MIFQMGILKFGLLCIDFLAWPMLALAYPLCASIRAIETGSKYHMRKLVTYWTVLSIVSLFEHTLRVMEWVPFWPYIKLVGTFWLIIPRFNGACYAYDCLVSADFGEKLHCILSQFSLSEDIKAMGQTTEQETEERKSEDVKAMGQTTEQETEERKSIDIKAMEQTTEQGTEERKVESGADSIGEMQRKETEATWVKATPVPNAAEKEKIIPEISSSKLIQREWTCAVCQVTTNSENDLKFHVRGRRHRTNCAELKSIKQEKKVQAIIKEKQAKESNVSSAAKDSRLYCGVCNIWCSDEAAMASHLKGRKHVSKLEQMAIQMANELAKQESNVKPGKATGLKNQVKNEAAKNGGSKQKTKVQANASDQKEWQAKEKNGSSVSTDSTLYCSLCNIRAPCEAGMVSHLKGRKHLSKLK